MTLRNIILNKPEIEIIDLMTPAGYVYVTKEHFNEVLEGTFNKSHLGFSDTKHCDNPISVYINVDIPEDNYNMHDNIFAAIVDYPENYN